MYIENKKIYYWASNDKENNGEGILAINFINLIKKNFEDYSLIPLNKFSKFNQDTFFYKYLLPFWGVLILWKCYFKRQNFSYINFLPAWNIILILVLPPKTIIGPVSGSINRDKFSLPIKLLTKLGIKILSIKYNQIIFSHDLFKKLIKNNKKKYLFNFLLYNFKLNKKKNKKKYDFIIYLRDHKNKRNNFVLGLLNEISKKYKICIIGKKLISKKNIYNQGFISRQKTIDLISKSRFALSGYENLYSYFLLDCLSSEVTTFYNGEFKILKDTVKTNLLIPINFNDHRLSMNTIFKNLNKKVSKKIKIKVNNFNNFFDNNKFITNELFK